MVAIAAKYCCYNGDFLASEDPVIHLGNRSFLYGDALSESIHACGTEAQFLNLHLERLMQSMQILKMIVPAYFTPSTISQLITRMLNKNRIFGGARIQLTVFRNSGGLFTPENNTVSFTLESVPIDHDHYTLNQQGYTVDLYTAMPKPIHRLSSIQSTSALLYVMAGLYKSEKGMDDCILVNEKGHLVESAGSNLFVFKNGQMLTPGIGEGCLPGIMRQVLISLLPSAGIPISESIPLAPSDLLVSDEVFLTNAVSGIRWVGAFQKKRYYRDVSHQLVQLLNKLAFG